MRLRQSSKLFIYCSLLCLIYPASTIKHELELRSTTPTSEQIHIHPQEYRASSCPSPAPTGHSYTSSQHKAFVSHIAYLYCNWRSRVYEHKIASVNFSSSIGRISRDGVLKALWGLALLVCYSFSCVMSFVGLLVSSVHFQVRYDPGSSFLNEWYELRQSSLVLLVLCLASFQWAIFKEALCSDSVSSKKSMIRFRMSHGRTLPLDVFQTQSKLALQRILLLSGDVELNPGPKGRGVHNQSTSEDPGYETEISNGVQDNSISQESTVPFEPANSTNTGPNFLHSLQRSLSVPASNLSKPIIETAYSGDLCTEPTCGNVPMHNKDEQIKELTGRIRELQQTIYEMQQQKCNSLTWPYLHVNQPHLLEIYSKIQMLVEDCFDHRTFKVQMDDEKQKLLHGLLKNFMEELKKENLWSSSLGFTNCPQSVQWVFFIVMNILLRLQAKAIYCPLCCCDKRTRCICKETCCACKNPKPCNCEHLKPCCVKDKHPKSHIWPKCMLLAQGDIHCYGTDRPIMNLTFNPPSFDSATTICLEMLCRVCEQQASQMENYLGNRYKFILRHPDNTVVIGEQRKMKKIFAVILIRGLFMNVNFLRVLSNDDFNSTLFDLLHYCTDQKEDLTRKLYMFMLPNVGYRPHLQNFLVLFELNLRSAHFTTLCKNEQGSYLYSKLDCFHCVYPLDDAFDDYLKENHSYEELDEEYRPYFSSSNPDSNIYFPPSVCRERIFPNFLLQENMEQTKKLLERLLRTTVPSKVPSKRSTTLRKCVSFIKLGQSSLLKNMSGYFISQKKTSIPIILLKTQMVEYNRHGQEEFEYLEECVEEATMRSCLKEIPFERIHPHNVPKYLKAMFGILQIKDQLERLNRRVKKVEVAQRKCSSTQANVRPASAQAQAQESQRTTQAPVTTVHEPTEQVITPLTIDSTLQGQELTEQTPSTVQGNPDLIPFTSVQSDPNLTHLQRETDLEAVNQTAPVQVQEPTQSIQVDATDDETSGIFQGAVQQPNIPLTPNIQGEFLTLESEVDDTIHNLISSLRIEKLKVERQ